MKVYKLAPILGVLLLALAASSCNRLKARDHLNKGVQAFRNAQFQPAIMHFNEAIRLDPSLLNARLYLATAYAQQYVPGGESPENKKIAADAIAAFEDVLKMDSGSSSASATALASIAQIYYSMKKFDDAKKYNQRRIEIEPNNPEPYYWIGVLDWAIAFPRTQGVRTEHNISQPNPKGELPPLPANLRKDLAEKNGPLVDEGLKALSKAIELKPNDADSMVYLNLMYRQKAEIDTDEADRQADLKQAESWVNKALAARKAGTASGSSEVAPSAAE
jgi:tetratricopeptide (TPR) repeat protein